MSLLKAIHRRQANAGLRSVENEALDDLNTMDVFKRCLEANDKPEEQHVYLLDAYQEILRSLEEEDTNAE